jgi:hypothetical protein
MLERSVVLVSFCVTICGFALIGWSLPEKHVNIPRMGEAPKIDGKLDNPLWKDQALKIEDFLQFAPKETRDRVFSEH